MRALAGVLLWAVATLVPSLVLFLVIGALGRPNAVHALVVLVASALGAAWLVRTLPLGRRRARDDDR